MGVPLKGRDQAQLIENAGLQFVDDAAEVLADFENHISPALAILGPIGLRFGVGEGEGQLEREQGHLLADVIMNSAGQPLVLLLVEQLLARQQCAILTER